MWTSRPSSPLRSSLRRPSVIPQQQSPQINPALRPQTRIFRRCPHTVVLAIPSLPVLRRRCTRSHAHLNQNHLHHAKTQRNLSRHGRPSLQLRPQRNIQLLSQSQFPLRPRPQHQHLQIGQYRYRRHLWSHAQTQVQSSRFRTHNNHWKTKLQGERKF